MKVKLPAVRIVVITWICFLGTSVESREPDFPTLDRNGNNNGYLEPNEIPTEDLAIIARYASLAGLDISRRLPISTLDRGRDKYFQSLDRSDEPGSVWERTADDDGFGRLAGKKGIRPFGAAGEMLGVYTTSNRNRTIGTFRNWDSNRDGLLSREEVGASYQKSAIYSWFTADHDDNGMLTFAELADYFAADELRQRISRARDRSTWKIDDVEVTLKHRQHADFLMSKLDKSGNGVIDRDEVPEEWKTGNGLSWADANRDGQITILEMQVGAVRFLGENELASKRKENPDLKTCDNLAADLFRRYDKNGDKALDRFERAAIRGDVSAADLNNNGLVHRDELSQWLLATLASQPGSKLPEGLPVWFVESDTDLDGQVLLSEFLRSGLATVGDFERYDSNGDGIVTADESAARTAGGKRRYSSGRPQVFGAVKETHAELFIDDDSTIADIDVQLAIAKNSHDDIELLLVGPDSTTVTLYYTGRSKPWGGGPLFEDTIIDDEAPEIRQRLPLPPAHRSFRPQGMNNKNLSSLSALYGKSARGTWRLVIRNKSRDAGLLEGWALLVKPAESVEP